MAIKQPVLRLTKQPSESRYYGIDFSNYAEINIEEESLAAVVSVVASPPDELVISEEMVRDEDDDGIEETVGFRLSGGVEGRQYTITVVVNTNAGNTLEGEGVLSLENL